METFFDYTVKKISLKVRVPVLKVFMHEQFLKIQTDLFWKFEMRIPKNISDNRKITAAV